MTLSLQNPAPQTQIQSTLWNITAVERDTGISKDTLRMWERRYGFPKPDRDAAGERSYPEPQVDKLRLLKRLTDSGSRPGKIIELDLEALRRLATAAAPAVAAGERADPEVIAQYMQLIREHDIMAFRDKLSKDITTNGIAATVKKVIAPLTMEVGESWRAGNLAIFEEHLFTESLHVVLRGVINQLARNPKHGRPPRILLTTFSQEPHSLGLLMAEAWFTLEGCSCISLGTQTPMWDIVQAALRQQADVVALSFSSGMGRQMVIDGLRELRHQLPPKIEIWAGGSSTALGRRMAEGVITTQALEDITQEVTRWRAMHPASAGKKL